MKTLILLAHPEVDVSSSQQFLLSAVEDLANVTVVDLQGQLTSQGPFQQAAELERLQAYDRLIFQFNLYWYQAPSILKNWLDVVLPEGSEAKNLAGKELGLVVSTGVSAHHFASGGRVGRTLSELLSPYESLARYFDWTYLPIFHIAQFSYLKEEAKYELLWRYRAYVETGNYQSEHAFGEYLIKALQEVTAEHLPINATYRRIFEAFVMHYEEVHATNAELYDLMEEW
ncbi:hypothetical protein CL176_11395 [Suicoccus acidiformans]|uniref:Flavodoxin-like fold domain-containing protein n=1 Tax=Suicoccus acidiformans TaxID=2036206 RepID=A0A347WN95_9LACT|nr:NAD(P)H-dependent oxidoreductase [Suicoccus acidiformans]AXY26552.1 hypothetical protein CL176_11395 [Suicoccus acidiformans]